MCLQEVRVVNEFGGKYLRQAPIAHPSRQIAMCLWVSTGLPECSPAIAACAHSRVLTLPSKVDARMRRPTSESLAAVLARSSRIVATVHGEP